MMIRRALAMASVLVVVAAGATAAEPSRTTEGDAQAVLTAFTNGGWSVLLHSGADTASPAQGLPGPVAIRPLGGSPFDGAHYCELDWHTIVLGDVEGGDRGYQLTDAAAVIDSIDLAFALDGAPLADVTRTAVTRFNNPELFDLEVAYGAQWGKVMAPGDLAVGIHTLEVEITQPWAFNDQITFTIDPAGSGTCSG